jgi:hypothetical protein
MSLKEDALHDIVLMAKHNNINLDDIKHALEASPILASKPSPGVLSK